jgi:hypothetical protein
VPAHGLVHVFPEQLGGPGEQGQEVVIHRPTIVTSTLMTCYGRRYR